MDQRKLNRLRRKLEQLRARSGIRSSELKRFARQLGRVRSRTRTNEPTYVSTLLPGRRPISIPDHPGDMNKYTAGGILDDFEADLDALEANLEQGE